LRFTLVDETATLNNFSFCS